MTFTYERTVYFRETDGAGVMYFANLFSICHEAYEASLIASGIDLPSFFKHPEFALPIAHASSDFFRPVLCGERLAIHLTPSLLKPSEFEITYQLRARANPAQVFGKACTRHVCIDPSSRSRRDLPPHLLQWLQQWQE